MAKDHAPDLRHDHGGPDGRGQDADRLVDLAKAQSLADGGLMTATLLAEALDDDPDHHEARILLERLHQICVPRWHFPMMADAVRNRAYARAIAARVRPGDVVLDIGCGAGLTAMMAARAGAAHVYACEAQPLIAEAAMRVIAQNGLSDRITVIPRASQDIEIGIDLPRRADVVVSEIVDTMLLGEGALATLDDAMRRLAAPGARTVPERGRVLAQPVESDALMALWRPQMAEGFDLRAFHHFATVAQITPNDFAACGMRALGPAQRLFRFDFARPDPRPARVTERLACSAAGTVHAVFVFFEMELSPGIRVSNGLACGGHWGRTAFLLDDPVPVAPGDILRITAEHDTTQPSVAVHGLEQRAGAAVPSVGMSAPGDLLEPLAV